VLLRSQQHQNLTLLNPKLPKVRARARITVVGPWTFLPLRKKQMEEFRNMLLSSQLQRVSWLEEMQIQSEDKFAKIEAELSNFFPAVD